MTTDILSALRWWAALTILGLAALPLMYTLLRLSLIHISEPTRPY